MPMQHPQVVLKTPKQIFCKNVPRPNVADAAEQQVMDPKTLLACCRCAKDFSHEHDLSDGNDTGINIMRTLNHRSRILEQFDEMTDAAKEKNWGEYLHLVCNLTQEAGLESVLSAAFSLKHATDMKKSFSTQVEAMDKAKELGLSPEAAMKCIKQTPSGRFTLYVTGKVVKSPDFKYPDVSSLVKIAQIEEGKSEVSCVTAEHDHGLLKAMPMIHTDDSWPSDFTFAHMAVSDH